MQGRAEIASRLPALVGDSLEIEELATGWPSLARLHVDDEVTSLALFVAPIGRSHRNRDEIERRFQNPGSVSIEDVPGRHSILLGLWDDDDLEMVRRPVIAIADAQRRSDGRTTRWSVFLLLEALKAAMNTGWETGVTASDERIIYVHPSLFPVAVAAARAGTEPSERLIYSTILTTGLLDAVDDVESPTNRDRIRRTVTSLVRDSKFSASVLLAYGHRCAMCALGLGLVQGAHIHPASAPGSVDTVANGLALCANHHLAFDRHLIAVVPDSLDVVFHPKVLEEATHDGATAAFVSQTVTSLRPAIDGRAPNPRSFELRYTHYRDQYEWAGALGHPQ